MAADSTVSRVGVLQLLTYRRDEQHQCRLQNQKDRVLDGSWLSHAQTHVAQQEHRHDFVVAAGPGSIRQHPLLLLLA